nr:MAG TPA: hypothetical protein [Caudoviricetes sp.]
MGMVSLADKALAETFASADYVIVVRKRADGKNDLYRATPAQIAKVVGESLQVSGIKANLNALKLTASDDGRGVVTLSLGGKTEWQT